MEKSNASLQARKRKLKVLPYNKAKKSWRRTTNFSCSFKCRSVESKSINNHEYQRSLSSTYEIHSLRWYNTKRFCSHHEEKTRLSASKKTQAESITKPKNVISLGEELFLQFQM